MSKVKPILFNSEMVRAILEGRKTVTRRVVKPSPPCELRRMTEGYHAGEWHLYSENPMIDKVNNSPWGAQFIPPYQPGDVLWVRETWGDYREHSEDGEGAYFLYRADYPDGATTYQYPDGPICDLPKWHPSIHMPKEAARIWLRVTNVRMERLQEIDEDGAISEGLYLGWRYHGTGSAALPARSAFQTLWNFQTPASKPEKMWAANPWVWVIEFDRCEKPEAVT